MYYDILHQSPSQNILFGLLVKFPGDVAMFYLWTGNVCHNL